MTDLALQLAFSAVFLVGVRSGQVEARWCAWAVVAALAQFGSALYTMLAGDTALAVGQGVAAGVWAQAAWELWRKRPRQQRQRAASRVANLGHRLATVAAS